MDAATTSLPASLDHSTCWRSNEPTVFVLRERR